MTMGGTQKLIAILAGLIGLASLSSASGQGTATPAAGVPSPKNSAREGAPPTGDDRSGLDQASLLAQGESTFDPKSPAALEVKRAPTGHLLVRPRVNGEQPGWFIFDTGAGVCVISTPKVEGLKLRAGGEIPAVGVGGTEGARLYRADEVVLGPMTLRDHPLMATDLSFLKQHLGDDIAGVIGYGVLSRCVCEIAIGSTTRAPRVAILDPKAYSLEREHIDAVGDGAAWTELRLMERIPVVRGKIEDHEAWFRLDTGANGAVTLHAAAVEKWNLLEGRETSDIKLGGVGGFVRGKSGTLRSMEVGGMRHTNVRASFAIEKRGSFANEKIDGNIGAELIRPFVLVLDYANERAAFLRAESDAKK